MPSLGESPVRGSPGRVALKLADAEGLYKSTLPEINERAANHVGRLIQHRSYLLVTERPVLLQQLEDRPSTVVNGTGAALRRLRFALCAMRFARRAAPRTTGSGCGAVRRAPGSRRTAGSRGAGATRPAATRA